MSPILIAVIQIIVHLIEKEGPPVWETIQHEVYKKRPEVRRAELVRLPSQPEA